MGSTLVTVAKDVKIQVEFNPAKVGAFRLIGYENRLMAHQDFNDDTKDAGEIGAGHHVTALYEIVPTGKVGDLPGIDPLKYTKPAASTASSNESFTVKLRYKHPDGDTSRRLDYGVTDPGRSFAEASDDLKFAPRSPGSECCCAVGRQGKPDLCGRAGDRRGDVIERLIGLSPRVRRGRAASTRCPVVRRRCDLPVPHLQQRLPS